MSLQSAEWFSRNSVECSSVSARNAGFPKHLHDQYVISANLTGLEEIWLAGKTAYVKSGQVTLYNPGTIQASRFDSQSVDFISVHMPQTVMKLLADEDNIHSDSQVPVLREGVIENRRLFNALYRFAASSHEGEGANEEQELMLLCGKLLESPALLLGSDEQRINVVIEYLRENLSVKPQLAKLAQMSGLSKYQLVRFLPGIQVCHPCNTICSFACIVLVTYFVETFIHLMRQ